MNRASSPNNFTLVATDSALSAIC